MVYFNCAGCGNGLKKNQIEQHKYQCKSRVFSCIDCNKDFKNDEYKLHTKCITESEKYESKSNFVAKANKGDLKQNAWLEKVTLAVKTFKGSNRAKSLLEKLVDYPNIPRKRAKFINFAKNSFRSFSVNDSLLDEIWNVIDSFDKQPYHKPQNLKRKLDESTTTRPTLDVKKIKPDNEDEQQKQCQDETIKFDWIDLIRNEITKKETHHISFAKLSKKIYKKYKKLKQINGEDQDDNDAFNKKLMKKLKKNSNLFQIVFQQTSAEIKSDITTTTINFESIIVKLNE